MTGEEQLKLNQLNLGTLKKPKGQAQDQWDITFFSPTSRGALYSQDIQNQKGRQSLEGSGYKPQRSSSLNNHSQISQSGQQQHSNQQTHSSHHGGARQAIVGQGDHIIASFNFEHDADDSFTMHRQNLEGNFEEDGLKITTSLTPSKVGLNLVQQSSQNQNRIDTQKLLKLYGIQDNTQENLEPGIYSPPQILSPGVKVPPNFDLIQDQLDVMTEAHVRCLFEAIPLRYQLLNWEKTYSSVQHGLSWNILLRKAEKVSPGILIVKDTQESIFGAIVTDNLRKMSKPHFTGTGETSVFQLEPQRVIYHWKRASKQRNDYFLLVTKEGIGVGGAGHFALFLDSDLNRGSSAQCETFGSPCLASDESFTIQKVEYWGLVE